MSRYRVNPETAELEDIEYILDDKPSIVDMIYPINSIYISMVNVNPSTYWEGTQWELLSDGYLRNNATAATGGSENSGSTTLTVNQIPSHNHTFTTSTNGTHNHTAQTSYSGTHGHTFGYANHTKQTVASNGTYSCKPTSYNTTSAGKAFTTSTIGNHSHSLATNTVADHTHTGTTQAIGGGQGHTHTIEPSYIRIYAYKRIA